MKKKNQVPDPKPMVDAPVDHPQAGYFPAALHKVRKLDRDFLAACIKIPPVRRQFTGDQQRLDYIQFVKENS